MSNNIIKGRSYRYTEAYYRPNHILRENDVVIEDEEDYTSGVFNNWAQELIDKSCTSEPSVDYSFWLNSEAINARHIKSNIKYNSASINIPLELKFDNEIKVNTEVLDMWYQEVYNLFPNSLGSIYEPIIKSSMSWFDKLMSLCMVDLISLSGYTTRTTIYLFVPLDCDMDSEEYKYKVITKCDQRDICSSILSLLGFVYGDPITEIRGGIEYLFNLKSSICYSNEFTSQRILETLLREIPDLSEYDLDLLNILYSEKVQPYWIIKLISTPIILAPVSKLNISMGIDVELFATDIEEKMFKFGFGHDLKWVMMNWVLIITQLLPNNSILKLMKQICHYINHVLIKMTNQMELSWDANDQINDLITTLGNTIKGKPFSVSQLFVTNLLADLTHNLDKLSLLMDCDEVQLLLQLICYVDQDLIESVFKNQVDTSIYKAITLTNPSSFEQLLLYLPICSDIKMITTSTRVTCILPILGICLYNSIRNLANKDEITLDWFLTYKSELPSAINKPFLLRVGRRLKAIGVPMLTFAATIYKLCIEAANHHIDSLAIDPLLVTITNKFE